MEKSRWSLTAILSTSEPWSSGNTYSSAERAVVLGSLLPPVQGDHLDFLIDEDSLSNIINYKKVLPEQVSKYGSKTLSFYFKQF